MSESSVNRLAHMIYHALPRAFDKKALQRAYDAGMIPKAKLEDGKTYEGHCRNTGQARWDASRQRFVYERIKFRDSYEDEMVHPEDDDGFDIFVPVAILK